MKTDIYVIGSYKGSKNVFVAFAEYADGTRWITQGERVGTKMDTEAQIMTVIFQYVARYHLDAVIHTDLIDAVKLVNNKWTSDFLRANTEISKRYVRYATEVRSAQKVEFITTLENKIFRTFRYLADTLQKTTKSEVFPERTIWQETIPRFSVTVKKPDGSVFDRVLTDYEFFGNLRDAKQLAAWWDKEVAKEGGWFYGYTVERFNVPSE